MGNRPLSSDRDVGERIACLGQYCHHSLTFGCFYKFVSNKVTDVGARYFEGVIGSPWGDEHSEKICKSQTGRNRRKGGLYEH